MLESLRSRYKHILVDEFQDTNAAQYALLQALAFGPSALSAFPSSSPSPSAFDEMSEEPVEVKRPTLVSAAALGPSVFVAGDDDQSIYSFQVPTGDTTSLHNLFRDFTPVITFPGPRSCHTLTDVCLVQRARGRARRSVPFWKTSLGRWRSAYAHPTACRATCSSPPRRYVLNFIKFFMEREMEWEWKWDWKRQRSCCGRGQCRTSSQFRRHEDEIALKMMRPATDARVCALYMWPGDRAE